MATITTTITNSVAHLFAVPEERHGDFHERIAKLDKRAKKAGLPALTVHLRKTTEEPIRPNSKLLRTIFHYAVETVDIISLGGWTLLGVIEYLPDGTPIVREVPGAAVPAEYRTDARTCDYCALDRNRKETFIVGHAEKGTKRVGRNCLSEFLGVDPKVWLSAMEWLKALDRAAEFDGGWGSNAPEYFTPLFLLTASARVAAVDGYRSRAAAEAYNAKVDEPGRGVRSTKDDTGTYLDALAGRLGSYRDRYGSRVDLNKEVLEHYGEVNDADVAKATTVLAFAKTFAGDSSYAYNLRTLAAADMVGWRHAGVLISAHGAYDRELAKARERANAAPAENVYLGKVGDKLTLKVTVANALTFDGNYGTRTLVTFKTDAGTSLKWWASGNKVSAFPKGEALTIKGTVKDHEEWKGTKSTVLTRVSTV